MSQGARARGTAVRLLGTERPQSTLGCAPSHSSRCVVLWTTMCCPIGKPHYSFFTFSANQAPIRCSPFSDWGLGWAPEWLVTLALSIAPIRALARHILQSTHSRFPPPLTLHACADSPKRQGLLHISAHRHAFARHVSWSNTYPWSNPCSCDFSSPFNVLAACVQANGLHACITNLERVYKR